MKTFIVKQSKYPIGNELYTPSYDLVNVGNDTERFIVAPGEFKLGEVIDEDKFYVEKRHYTDGTFNVHGNFAVKKPKTNKYKIRVVVEVEVESALPDWEQTSYEFTSESDYTFESTDNVTVINTEWIETERTF